ncbi:cytochrome c oxidase subunit 3, partial [Enterobacter cloacae]
HGLHVTAGLVWIIIMMIQVSRRGLTDLNRTRLSCLSLFWHFLDVVWICVFRQRMPIRMHCDLGHNLQR